MSRVEQLDVVTYCCCYSDVLQPVMISQGPCCWCWYCG